MIQDFLDQEPAIYGPSFKHERNPAMLNLEIDKYFTVWLSGHWNAFFSFTENCCFADGKQQAEAEVAFAEAFSSLLQKWSILKSKHPAQVNLGLVLIDDMLKMIDAFVKAGEKANLLRNRLEVALEKNSTLFERMIEQQKGL